MSRAGNAVLSVAFAIAVASCATIGHRFDYTRVSELTPGVSTRDDAIRALGTPTAESSYADGSRLLQWQYVSGNALGRGSGSHVAILFDRDGKMIRVTHVSHL
jgi:hypothetical protein